MTESQEKIHNDPMELSSRTPLGQLMRQAVEHTHQTGADGTNAPHPSKKMLFIFVSPWYMLCISWRNKRFSLQYCLRFLDFIRNNLSVLDKTFFKDEAWFNSQNTRI
jgi:hypothetical protein